MRKTRLLTDIAIRNARPKLINGIMVRDEIADRGCPGLYLAVQPTGGKGFAHRYRFAGKTRRDVLEGAWPALSLADARKQVAAARALLAKGVDPKPQPQPKPAAAKDTFAEIARRHWQMKAAKGVRSAARSLAELERLVFAELGDRPIADIRKSDVVRVLDGIALKQGFRTHDKVSADIRQVMVEHSLRSDDYICPLVKGIRLLKPKERARKRILTDEELRKVVVAAEANGLFGAFVRFLLLTACRRNEAALMPWSELSRDGKWTLPAVRNKTKEVLCRPLSRAALAVLAGLPRGDSELVFHATEGRPLVKSFADRKAKFDRACGVTGWTQHDLRRTARSLMSRAKVPLDHAERVLGHVIGGVRGVYDQHAYEPEILAAYESLAALVERIVHPQDNIVELGERRA
jgi:integrase